MPKEKGRDKKQGEGIGGAVFMIGLGVLFLVDDVAFWPWILVVIGLSGAVESIPQEGLWAGSQGLVWMAGLAILFETGQFWPGILILIGLSTLVGALVRPPMLEKDKRKRGLPPDEPIEHTDYLDEEI